MIQRDNFKRGAALAMVVTAMAFGAAAASRPAAAQTIIDEWHDVKVPPAPALKPVTVDWPTTALLVLDFNGAKDATMGPCNSTTKPRCLASVPKVAKLLSEARAKGMLVVFSVGGTGTTADIMTALTPKDGEAIIRSGADKFVGTDLEKILTAKHITSLIVTGTASEGAVLDTATDAALKGMNIILPVDGMSSTQLYAEQYVAWHMANARGVSTKTTLTKVDLISF